MKKFTKGQLIFVLIYPIISLILFCWWIFLNFKAETDTIAQEFLRLAAPVMTVICYVPYLMGYFLRGLFSSHLHWAVQYFLAIVYNFLLGFIFVITYTKIRNR